MTYAAPYEVGALRGNRVLISGMFTLNSPPGSPPQIVRGTGWTVDRISPANYRVTMTDSIAEYESISCSMNGEDFPYFCTIKFISPDPPGPGTASFIVETFVLQNGVLNLTDSSAATCTFMCLVSLTNK